jgi:hypothetical protein
MSSKATAPEPDLMQAAQALVEGFDLSEKERAFVLQYHCGEHRGNGTRSMMAANAKLSYAAAATAASEALKSAEVQRFSAAFHQHVLASTVQNEIVPWSDLVPLAQGVLVATARGRLRSRLAMEAAVHVLDRALGRPMLPLQHSVIDRTRVRQALAAHRQRMETEAPPPRAVQLLPLRPDMAAPPADPLPVVTLPKPQPDGSAAVDRGLGVKVRYTT